MYIYKHINSDRTGSWRTQTAFNLIRLFAFFVRLLPLRVGTYAWMNACMNVCISMHEYAY